jgi:hypothetical protein
MPRKSRYFVPTFPSNIILRGNNRQPIFFADIDYCVYPGWLAEATHRWD